MQSLVSEAERQSRIMALPSETGHRRSPSGALLAVATVCGPAGSLLPIPGATSPDDCQPCPAGWFCSRAGLSSPEATCEGGWFCPRASVSGHSPGKGRPSSRSGAVGPPVGWPGRRHAHAPRTSTLRLLSPRSSEMGPCDCTIAPCTSEAGCLGAQSSERQMGEAWDE